MNWGRKKEFISEENVQSIINSYTIDNKSVETIFKETNMSMRAIENTLIHANVYRFSNQKRTYVELSKNVVAKCKKTFKTFDYKNSGGAITRHIQFLYPDIELPTAYKARQYYKKNNKFWFEEYNIEIVEIETTKINKKCKYCDWTTNDVENKSGCYRFHLENIHQLTLENHIQSYPDEKELFKTYFINQEKQNNTDLHPKNNVTCPICNQNFKYITNTHLLKHGINKQVFQELYPENSLYSEDFIQKTTAILKESSKKAKNNFISKAEIEIAHFIESELNLKVESRNKSLLKGVEIDLLIHDLKIGIEYNGCYYHTELGNKKTKNFHLNKSNLMKNVGYKLIHIFEDEWIHKKEIVLSKIKHILNKNNNTKIFARKCKVVGITKEQKSKFLSKNHIQGNDASDIIIGLEYNNELISIMTFDQKRQMISNRNDKDSYELTRFATNINFQCIGMAGKLLSHFIKTYNPKKIISFADISWTGLLNSNVYSQLGFEMIKQLPPDYKYFNPKVERNKRLHKFGFGKSSIKTKFPEIYDQNKTEWEMMQEAGYDRIWDCGKLRYEMEIKNPNFNPD